MFDKHVIFRNFREKNSKSLKNHKTLYIKNSNFFDNYKNIKNSNFLEKCDIILVKRIKTFSTLFNNLQIEYDIRNSILIYIPQVFKSIF